MNRFALVAAAVAVGFPALVHARSFVLPHVLEKSGMRVVAAYTGGLPGARAARGAGANVNLYLYARNGSPMAGANGRAVCNPCTYRLGPTSRTESIDISALVRGATAESARLGFGVIVVDGGDPDSVNLQGFVVNSHDISVFGFEPQPIAAEAQ